VPRSVRSRRPPVTGTGPVHRIQQGLVVVVPGDHHDVPAVLAQDQQAAHDQALRLRGRCRGLEEIPGTPEIDTCAPRVPSTNSKFTKTGCPSRPNPTGTFEAPISSKYSAESRVSVMREFDLNIERVLETGQWRTRCALPGGRRRLGASRRKDCVAYSVDVAYERITVNPNRMSGLPCIRDTRVTVSAVLGQLAAGRSIEEILVDYPYLDRDDILAALEFAAAAVQERELPLAQPA